MKVRVVYDNDKILKVIHPAINAKKAEETEEQWLARVFNKVTPKGATYKDIDINELPSREYRDAWVYDKGIKIDPAKVEEIDAKKKPTLADIDKAKTVDELKEIVKKLL